MIRHEGKAGERHIPLVDLSRLDADLLSEALSTFERVARAGTFTLGPDLEAFERDFAAYCGTRHCVGVSDGTNALRLALLALGAAPGADVVTVTHTFVATVEAISMTGARPVLVDIDPSSRCMDPRRLAEAIGPQTIAVVPVHLYGAPAAMKEILEVCGEIPVLEDAAQAHGARLGGRRMGSIGSAGAFSFYPTKNLGAFGDGGAVISDDPEFASAIRSLRHHGAAPADPNRHVRAGSTARLDNLQAAILRLKLPRLDEWNLKRRKAADLYRSALAGLPVTLPRPDSAGSEQVYHLFAIEIEDRDRVLGALRARGIGASVHYPTPVHLQPGWRHLGYTAGDLPASEAAARRTLSLPLFPDIGEDEIADVVQALASAL